MELTQNQLVFFFAGAAWFFGFSVPPILSMVKRRNLSLLKVITGTERAEDFSVKEKVLLAVGITGGLVLTYIGMASN